MFGDEREGIGEVGRTEQRDRSRLYGLNHLVLVNELDQSTTEALDRAAGLHAIAPRLSPEKPHFDDSDRKRVRTNANRTLAVDRPGDPFMKTELTRACLGRCRAWIRVHAARGHADGERCHRENQDRPHDGRQIDTIQAIGLSRRSDTQTSGSLLADPAARNQSSTRSTAFSGITPGIPS